MQSPKYDPPTPAKKTHHVRVGGLTARHARSSAPLLLPLYKANKSDPQPSRGALLRRKVGCWVLGTGSVALHGTGTRPLRGPSSVFAAPTGRTQKRRKNIMNAHMCMFSCVAWLLPADPTSAAVFGLFVALVCHCCCCAAQLVVCAGCRFSSAHLLVCHLLHGPSRVFAVP